MIRRHLNVGADAPTTYPMLAERMGVTEREAMQAVQDARLAGVPIVSGARGLWIAATSQEARQSALALRRRAITQLVTARALRRAADLMEPVEQTSWLDAA